MTPKIGQSRVKIVEHGSYLWRSKIIKIRRTPFMDVPFGSMSIHQSPVKSFPQNSSFATLLEADLTRKGCIILCQTRMLSKTQDIDAWGWLNRGKLSLHFMRFCFAFEIKTIAHPKRNREDILLQIVYCLILS